MLIPEFILFPHSWSIEQQTNGLLPSKGGLHVDVRYEQDSQGMYSPSFPSGVVHEFPAAGKEKVK
jgi:hypothetical protein